MTFFRRAVAGATAAAAIIALTACGSNSSSGSDSTAGANEIVIGTIGTYTGVQAAQMGGIPTVLGAWADSMNAAGGVNGAKIRLVNKDIGSAPAGAGLTAAKELVEQDNVDAIVSIDAADLQWANVATDKNIPVVAGITSLGALLSPKIFPTVTSIPTLGYAYPETAKQFGPKLAAAYQAEVPATKGVTDQMATFGAPLGVTLSTVLAVSSSLPDYTATCQAIKDSGADSYSLLFASDVVKNIANQCVQQGLHIPLIIPAGLLPSYAKEPGFQTAHTIDFQAPYFDNSIAGVKEYRDVLTKFAPGFTGSEADTAQVFNAWVGVRMLQTALGKVQGAVTPEALQKAFYTIKDETLGDLIPAVTYTEGQTTSRDCWYNWTVENSQFTAPVPVKPVCADPAILQPVMDEFIKSLSG